MRSVTILSLLAAATVAGGCSKKKGNQNAPDTPPAEKPNQPSLSVPSAAVPVTWSRGTVPGTRLSVEMPGTPKALAPWSNGNANVQVANAALACETGRWQYEALCVTATHSDPAMQKVVEGDQVAAGLLKLPVGTQAPAGRVVRKAQIGGHEAVVVSAKVPQGRQVRMIFGTGARSYTLSVMGPGVEEDHPDVKRFLDSARFD